MDVIEIDAASNRGINEMREPRESVRLARALDRESFHRRRSPSDHQRSLQRLAQDVRGAAPEWVVFLLCTTESHKIPSTIVSRRQQFSSAPSISRN